MLVRNAFVFFACILETENIPKLPLRVFAKATGWKTSSSTIGLGIVGISIGANVRI
jgi:hypothetical protein